MKDQAFNSIEDRGAHLRAKNARLRKRLKEVEADNAEMIKVIECAINEVLGKTKGDR